MTEYHTAQTFFADIQRRYDAAVSKRNYYESQLAEFGENKKAAQKKYRYNLTTCERYFTNWAIRAETLDPIVRAMKNGLFYPGVDRADTRQDLARDAIQFSL